MPAAKPPEFRRRAVALARVRISRSPESEDRGDLTAPLAQAGRPGRRLTSDERTELAELRRRNRTLQMEMEILKRARADLSGRRNAPI